jgi:hypothetical protein
MAINARRHPGWCESLVGQGKAFAREGQAVKLKLTATKVFSKIVKLTYEPLY